MKNALLASSILFGLCLSASSAHIASAAPRSPKVTRALVASPWPTVRRGDRDELNFRVTIVQYLLRAHNFTVPVTGTFGLQTQNAVRRFQRSRGLPITGIVATKTWTKLIIKIQKGSTGNAVRAAQTVLHDVASPQVTIDGQFGSQTDQAVRSFQKVSGLTSDGIVGSVTWKALTANFFD